MGSQSTELQSMRFQPRELQFTGFLPSKLQLIGLQPIEANYGIIYSVKQATGTEGIFGITRLLIKLDHSQFKYPSLENVFRKYPLKILVIPDACY